LADVYMSLTGGQSKFEFNSNNLVNNELTSQTNDVLREGIELISVTANKNDLKEHESRLADIEDRNSVETIWRKIH